MGRPGKRAERKDTKDKAAPADEAREEALKRQANLQKGSIKGFIERLALWSDVVNWNIGNRKLKEVNSTNELKRQRMSGTLAQRYHGWDNRAKQRL